MSRVTMPLWRFRHVPGLVRSPHPPLCHVGPGNLCFWSYRSETGLSLSALVPAPKQAKTRQDLPADRKTSSASAIRVEGKILQAFIYPEITREGRPWDFSFFSFSHCKRDIWNYGQRTNHPRITCSLHCEHTLCVTNASSPEVSLPVNISPEKSQQEKSWRKRLG